MNLEIVGLIPQNIYCAIVFCISPVIANLNPSKSDFTMVRNTGLFDSTVTEEYLSKEIINCLSMAKEGIHAVLFVLSVKSRLSKEEELTLHSLQRIFEAKILDYFIVVFTGGDELEADGPTLDEYLGQDCPLFLKVNLLSSRSLFFFSFLVSRMINVSALLSFLCFFALFKNNYVSYDEISECS